MMALNEGIYYRSWNSGCCSELNQDSWQPAHTYYQLQHPWVCDCCCWPSVLASHKQSQSRSQQGSSQIVPESCPPHFTPFTFSVPSFPGLLCLYAQEDIHQCPPSVGSPMFIQKDACTLRPLFLAFLCSYTHSPLAVPPSPHTAGPPWASPEELPCALLGTPSALSLATHVSRLATAMRSLDIALYNQIA